MPSLNHAILVFLGGGCGALLRFLVGKINFSAATSFPATTLLINIVGSFFIGYLASQLPTEKYTWARPLLMVGVLGGFTTFSAFSLESLTLLQSGRVVAAGSYVLLSVLGCLVACYLGTSL